MKVNRKALRDTLADLVGVGGLLAGTQCRLFTTAIEANTDTKFDDLYECDFAGYAPISVTWGTPYNKKRGAAVSGGKLVFACTGQATGQAARGYALVKVDGAGTLTFMIHRFDIEQTVKDLGSVVIADIELGLESLDDDAP